MGDNGSGSPLPPTPLLALHHWKISFPALYYISTQNIHGIPLFFSNLLKLLLLLLFLFLVIKHVHMKLMKLFFGNYLNVNDNCEVLSIRHIPC